MKFKVGDIIIDNCDMSKIWGREDEDFGKLAVITQIIDDLITIRYLHSQQVMYTQLQYIKPANSQLIKEKLGIN